MVQYADDLARAHVKTAETTTATVADALREECQKLGTRRLRAQRSTTVWLLQGFVILRSRVADCRVL